MPRTILVIDDNKSVRDALRFILDRRGYGVALAESGSVALALSEQQQIDGAMIDVNMPGMNGLTVCRTLLAQAAAKGRKMSVWMMTGARTPELIRMSVEAGALTLLAKPFELVELFRQFDEAMGPQEPPTPLPQLRDVLDELEADTPESRHTPSEPVFQPPPVERRDAAAPQFPAEQEGDEEEQERKSGH